MVDFESFIEAAKRIAATGPESAEFAKKTLFEKLLYNVGIYAVDFVSRDDEHLDYSMESLRYVMPIVASAVCSEDFDRDNEIKKLGSYMSMVIWNNYDCPIVTVKGRSQDLPDCASFYNGAMTVEIELNEENVVRLNPFLVSEQTISKNAAGAVTVDERPWEMAFSNFFGTDITKLGFGL